MVCLVQVEIYAMKFICGALCVASAPVLHPTYSIEWYYRAAAGCVLCACLLYTALIGCILYNRCSLDGEQCSYILDTCQIQDPGPVDMEESCLAHKADSEGTGPAPSIVPEPQPRPDIDDAGEAEGRKADASNNGCAAAMRRKKGSWHGGVAEQQAALKHDCMVDAVGKWLVLWKADLPVGVPTPRGTLPRIQHDIPTLQRSELDISVSNLEEAYNKVMKRPTYFVGNVATWCVHGHNSCVAIELRSYCRCCTPCYPACSDQFSTLAARIADDLEFQVSSPQSLKEKVDSAPPPSATAHLELEIWAVIEKCQEAYFAHLEAVSFLSQYGSLFRKYDGDHRYTELLGYVHTIVFALAVGLLQHHTRAQATASFGLCLSLLCYYVCARPFNEFLRNHLEVCSLGCMVAALGLILLHEFEILRDVGGAVNGFSTGYIGFKVAYQICVLVRFWCRKRKRSNETTERANFEVPERFTVFDTPRSKLDAGVDHSQMPVTNDTQQALRHRGHSDMVSFQVQVNPTEVSTHASLFETPRANSMPALKPDAGVDHNCTHERALL